MAATTDARTFEAAFGRPPVMSVRAPGRVDLIGAHVDYNEGQVLVVAIDREVRLSVAPAVGELTTVVASDLGERASFGRRDLEQRLDAAGRELPVWARYPAGVQWSLAQEGLATPPLEVLVTGNLPMGAGLSSSAALEVAFALAWREAGGWTLPPLRLAELCRRAENQYVGVACGLMDQFASALGRARHALLLDCRTLHWEPVALPRDTAIVVADTGTRRQLSDGRLNERQSECADAVRWLAARRPEVRALRDVTVTDLEPAPGGGPPEGAWPAQVRDRAVHVVTEMERVGRTAELLRAGESEAAGALLNASHVSARDLYDVSGPELEAMWAAATAHPDCLGGRAVGAGFAGCMVFLVRASALAPFVEETSRRYRRATGRVPRLERVRAAPGASVSAPA